MTILEMLKLIFPLCLVTLFSWGCYLPNELTKEWHSDEFLRKSNGSVEQIKIDFERQLFTYFQKKDSSDILINGSVIKNDSTLTFEFPAFSEYEGLPFFPQENFEIIYLDTSTNFEIDITIIDIETQEEIERYFPIHVAPPQLTGVKDYEGKQKLIVTSLAPKIDLIFDRTFTQDRISIPKKGKYKLNFQMLSSKTTVIFSTADKACYMETINPEISMKICKELNQRITSFDHHDNCETPFVYVDQHR